VFMGQSSCGSKIRNAYKSKGEEQIARLLEREGIKYQYEHPLAVVDRGKIRTWYPDFSLPQYALIIEYFGLNGDKSYNGQVQHKMDVYKENGIEGLFLTESSFKGNWPDRIMGQIEDILKGRLERFYNRNKDRRQS